MLGQGSINTTSFFHQLFRDFSHYKHHRCSAHHLFQSLCMCTSSCFETFSVLQAEGKAPLLCVIQMFPCQHSSYSGVLWQRDFSAIRAVSWKLLGSADLSAIRSVLLGIGCFLITSFKERLGCLCPTLKSSMQITPNL